MIFVAIKYSNSVRMYSYCRLITVLGFLIKAGMNGDFVNKTGYYQDARFYLYLSFCPMWIGYLLFFIGPACGE